MKELFDGFAKWGPIVAICWIIVFVFTVNVIFPLEKTLIPHLVEVASVFFLPHAARVLSTAIVGPRAFFALFPAMMAVDYFQSSTVAGEISTLSVLASLASASCAPLAYLFVSMLSKQRIDFKMNLFHWRTILAIGVVASAFNSIMRAFIYQQYYNPESFAGVMIKVFIGDVVGLMVGLVGLVFIFRIVRGRPLSEDI